MIFGGGGQRRYRRGRVRVIGCAPGCLITSLLLSLTLTIVLNVLIRAL